MKRFVWLTLGVILIGFFSPNSSAQATIVKAKAEITLPTYVFAGVANPVDVSVCAMDSFSSDTCTSGVERTVTLWANGRIVQTVKTIGGGGQASFIWTPKGIGSITLKATVTAASFALRSLTSEAKKVTVRGKVKSSSIGTLSCGSTCVQGIPDTLNLNNDEVITAGLSAAMPAGRRIHFQTLRVSNHYVDVSSAVSTWQSDINRYGIALSFAQIDTYAECTPGTSVTWNFRFYADASKQSPASATKAKWINIVCPRGSGSGGEIQLDVSYSDQFVDYSYDCPEDMGVTIDAPDSTEYSVYSLYCSEFVDCSNESNWHTMDGQTGLWGSQTLSVSVDPGDYGTYLVKIEVIPLNTDQDIFYSESYTVALS